MHRALIFAALGIALLAGGANAQVRKCTGPDGKVTYSDSFCAGNATSESAIRLQANTVDGSGLRREAKNQRVTQAAADALASNPKQCTFSYYAHGDSKGQALAKNAKAECLANLEAKAAGRPLTLDSYDAWKDHRAQTGATRDAAMQRATTAQAAQTIATSNAAAVNAAAQQNAKRPLTCTKVLGLNAMECR